jgi:hypothetical protein
VSITIIKQPASRYRAACRKCGCVFEYELSDLTCRYSYSPNEVACPSCREPHRHPNQESGS